MQRDLIAIFGLNMPGRRAEPTATRGETHGLHLQRRAGGRPPAGRRRSSATASTHERLKADRGGGRRRGPFDRDLWTRAGRAPACSASPWPRTSAERGSTSGGLPGPRGGRPHRGLRARWSRRWSTAAAADRRFGTDAQRKTLAARRRQRRDHPHRRHGRAGRRGDPARRRPSRPPRRPRRPTARGCSRAPRPACRRPSWPTPSSCRPPARPPTARSRASGSSSSTPRADGRHLDAADHDDRAAPRRSSSSTACASAATGSLGEGADGAAVIDVHHRARHHGALHRWRPARAPPRST